MTDGFVHLLYNSSWNSIIMLDSWTASHLSACWQTPGSCYSSILNFTWLATPPSSAYHTCRTVHIHQWMFLVRSIIKVANNLEHIFDPFKSFWRNYTFQSQSRLGTIQEHQAMSSFHDVANDGWRIYYITAAEILSAHSWAASVRATGTVRKRQTVQPVRHLQNHSY